MSDFEVVLPRTTEEWQRDMNFAYEKGRADKEKELSELPNQYSEKLWKIAYNKGKADMKKEIEEHSVFYSNRPIEDIVLEARNDAIDEFETKLVDIILGNEEFTDWQKQEISLCLECVIEQLKEQNNE